MSNIPQILDFLNLLAVNNNRDWFNEHKSEYTRLRNGWLDDLGKLLSCMSEYEPALANVEAKQCAYRIYRDTRFSANKLPYKNHFGALLGVGGTKCPLASYYLHIQPGDCGIYGGLWCPERDVLNALRHAIDDNFEEFTEIIDNPDFKSRFLITGDTLKKLPQGFSPETPAAKYVKMKEYLLAMQVPDDFFNSDDWVEKVADNFRYMKPFNDFLNYTITEEL